MGIAASSIRSIIIFSVLFCASIEGFSLQGASSMRSKSSFMFSKTSRLASVECIREYSCPHSITMSPSALHSIPPAASVVDTVVKDASVAATTTSTSVPPLQAPNQESRAPPLKATPQKTMKKLLPLGAMLFFILFNYTILRDTKDVLVVTAPNSGAEIIPFLKTYVNLPSALGFTVLYSYLCNKMSNANVFYVLMSSFLAFFGAFAGFICDNSSHFVSTLLVFLAFLCPNGWGFLWMR